MTCEPRTSHAGSAEACGPVPSSDGNPSTPSTSSSGESTECLSSSAPDGGHPSATTAPTSPTGSRPSWMDRWICSQQASLAAISASQAAARDSAEAVRAQRIADASAQLTLFDLPGCSLKTPQRSAPEDLPPYWLTYATEDIERATESLPRLMLEVPTSGTDGICSHIGPTLTVHGNYNRHGVSPKAGDGLATWCTRRLPTLLASDGRGGVDMAQLKRQPGRTRYSNIRACLRTLPTLLASDGNKVGRNQHTSTIGRWCARQQPSTAAPGTGIRLTPAFAAWWMGWPIHVVMPAATSAGSEMPGCRSKPPLRGDSSEVRDA